MYIRQSALHLRDELDLDVPRTVDELCSLAGVGAGPKMAFVCNMPRGICTSFSPSLLLRCVIYNLARRNVDMGVDIYVHCITNRPNGTNCPSRTPNKLGGKKKNLTDLVCSLIRSLCGLNLQSWLPTEFYKEINNLLVGFGQVCPRLRYGLLTKRITDLGYLFARRPQVGHVYTVHVESLP
jgi:endonuclease-3